MAVSNIKSKCFTRSGLYVGVVTICYTASAISLIQLFYEDICAFTNEKFALFDYGVYTNAIWNTLHGHFFRCLVDRNYLTTHLSFSLILLSPLYVIWNHPFALWVAQWLFLVTGVVFLTVAGRRFRIQGLFVAALGLFYIVYCFTQSTILEGFHGVSLFLIIIPVLYYVLNFEKRLSPFILLILFGIREEAAFTVIPILLYFAWRDSWKWGYWYALASLVYGLLATFGLYPLISGMSLYQRRAGSISDSALHLLSNGTLKIRAQSLLWICIPLLPLLRKRTWAPLILFPSICVMQALLGERYQQYSLSLHYPAAIMAYLTVGLLEAGRIISEGRGRRSLNWIALYILTAALFSNAYRGFLPGFRVTPVPVAYRRIRIHGLYTLHVASRLPKRGLLLCHYTLAGFCANRSKIISYKEYNPRKYRVDLIFGKVYSSPFLRAAYLKFSNSQKYGVTYFDGALFVALIFSGAVVKAYDKRKRFFGIVLALLISSAFIGINAHKFRRTPLSYMHREAALWKTIGLKLKGLKKVDTPIVVNFRFFPRNVIMFYAHYDGMQLRRFFHKVIPPGKVYYGVLLMVPTCWQFLRGLKVEKIRRYPYKLPTDLLRIENTSPHAIIPFTGRPPSPIGKTPRASFLIPYFSETDPTQRIS